MPTITNTTIIKHATPICKTLRERGDNLTNEAVAAIVVKAVLEELGCVDALSADMLNDRKEVIALVKVFFTAPKNCQVSYFSETNGTDGVPLMPKPDKVVKADSVEFA